MVDVTLEMLQTMVQRVLDGQRLQSEELQDIKLRLGGIERSLVGLRRENADDADAAAHMQAQIDRLGDRMARIERRLEISD